MTTSITTVKFGRLDILEPAVNRGGEGRIHATNNTELLIKVLDPLGDMSDGERRQYQMRKQLAYSTFASLNLDKCEGLRCLPREYIVLPDGTPAYVMNKAHGESLSAVYDKTFIDQPLTSRLMLVLGIIRAVEKLHSSQIVHADIKPENFYFAMRQPAGSVQILDVDSGGYRARAVSGRSAFAPTGIPSQKQYVAPELVKSGTWGTLWQSYAWEPDLWALAVLLYSVLIDYDGPFPTRAKRQLSGLRHVYEPYAQYEITGCSPWPKPWQEELMDNAQVPVIVIDSLKQVFDGERDATRRSFPRLTAYDWRVRLESAQGRTNPAGTTQKAAPITLPPVTPSPLLPMPIPSSRPQQIYLPSKLLPTSATASQSTVAPAIAPSLARRQAIGKSPPTKRWIALAVLIAAVAFLLLLTFNGAFIRVPDASQSPLAEPVPTLSRPSGAVRALYRTLVAQ